MGQTVKTHFAKYAVLGVLLCSCATSDPSRDREWVSGELSERLGAGIPLSETEPTPSTPPGLQVSDGLDIDEAVAYSLWNHPDFAATVAQLGVSRAELHQAGLLRNPILAFLFPLGPKQLEATLQVAVDVLWQRDQRIEMAQGDLFALSERLVAAGLGQAQAARQAFVESLWSRRKTGILAQVVALEEENIALLVRALGLGDIAEIVVDKARVQMDLSKLDSEGAELELAHQLTVLREALGGDIEPAATDLVEMEDLIFMTSAPVEDLCQRALAARPDLRAIEFELESGIARAGLAAKSIPTLELIVDANGEGTEGFEIGPGVWVELPIFDTGGARVDIAESQLLVIIARRRALERRICEDVKRLYADYTNRLTYLTRAQREFETGTKVIMESLVKQRRLGDINELEVVAYQRLLLAQKLKLAEWRYRVQNAHISLEAAVGAKLSPKLETKK
ncbi:MAG: cobalt-zinc-cadmium efflux system outer membrane protein [Planctomycetota bacterium]|jgi:cobalt-zinc-cadmium efflux system outer membrane protein